MNIIDRLCGPEWLHRREQLLRERGVPLQSELRQRIGGRLTDTVLLPLLDESCARLMGTVPPMRGPDLPLWVSPTDVLQGVMRLKPPAAASQLRASGHSTIVEFGADVVRKFQNELRGEVLHAIYEVQKHMRWACAEDVRRIEQATRAEERRLCELSKDTLVKKVAVDMEKVQESKKKNVDDNLAILIQKERKEVQELMDDKMKYAFRVKDTEDRKKCRAAIDAALDQQAAEYQRVMDEMRLKIMQSMSNALEELRAEKECYQRQLESDILTDVAATVVAERLRSKREMTKRDALKSPPAGWAGTCPASSLKERAEELEETVQDSRRLLRYVMEEFHRFAAYVQKERPSQSPAMLTMDSMTAFETRLLRPLDKCKPKDETRSEGEESGETSSKESGTEQSPSKAGRKTKKRKRKSKKSLASKEGRDSVGQRTPKAEGPAPSTSSSEKGTTPWDEEGDEAPRRSKTSADDPLATPTPTPEDTPKTRELRCFSLTSVERLVLNALDEVEAAAQIFGGLIPEDPPYPDPCMRRALDAVAAVVPGVDEGVVAAIKEDGAAAKLGGLLCTPRGPENVHYPSSESDGEGDEGRRREFVPKDSKLKKNILLPGAGSPDGGVETLFDSDYEQEAKKLLEDMETLNLHRPVVRPPQDVSGTVAEDASREPEPFCLCSEKPRYLIVPPPESHKELPDFPKRKPKKFYPSPFPCPMTEARPESPFESQVYSDDYDEPRYSDGRFVSYPGGQVGHGFPEDRGPQPETQQEHRARPQREGVNVKLVNYEKPSGSYPDEKRPDREKGIAQHTHPYDRHWVKSGRYSDVGKKADSDSKNDEDGPDAAAQMEDVTFVRTSLYRELSRTPGAPNYVAIGGPGFPDELGRRYNPCICTEEDKYSSLFKVGKVEAGTKWATMLPVGQSSGVSEEGGKYGQREYPGYYDDLGRFLPHERGLSAYFEDVRFQKTPQRDDKVKGRPQEKGHPEKRGVEHLRTYDSQGRPGFPFEEGPGVPPYPPSNKQDSRRSSLEKGASTDEEKGFVVKPIYKKDVKRPSSDISGLGFKYGERGIIEEKVPPIFVEVPKSSTPSEQEGEDDGSLKPMDPEDLIAPMYPFDRADPCNVECDALCAPHDLVEFFDLPGGRDGTERPDFYDRGPLHRGRDTWRASDEDLAGEAWRGAIPQTRAGEKGEEGDEGEECVACMEVMREVRYPAVPCIPGYTGKEGFPAVALTPCDRSDVCPAMREAEALKEGEEHLPGKYLESKVYTPTSIGSGSSNDVVNVLDYELFDHETVDVSGRPKQDPQWKGEHWAQPFIVAPSLGTCPAAEWPTKLCPTAYLLPIGVSANPRAKRESALAFPHRLSRNRSSVKGSQSSGKESFFKRGKASKTKFAEAKESVKRLSKDDDEDDDADKEDSPITFGRMRPSGIPTSGAGGEPDESYIFSRMRASGVELPPDMTDRIRMSKGSLRSPESPMSGQRAYGTDPYVTASAVPYEAAGTTYPVPPSDYTRRSSGAGSFVVPGQPGIPPSGFPRDSRGRRTSGASGERSSLSRTGTVPCKGSKTQPSVCAAKPGQRKSMYPGLKRAATAVAVVAAGLPSLALGPHPGAAASLSPKDSMRCRRADLCAIDRLMARGAIASPAEYWRLMQRGAIKPSGSKERVGPRVSVATLSEQELLGLLDPCGHRLPSRKDTQLASIPETPPPSTDTDACPAMTRLERVRQREKKTGEQLATALMERLEKERLMRKPQGKKGEGALSPKEERHKGRASKAPAVAQRSVEGEANARVMEILRKLSVHPSLTRMFVGAGA